MTDTNRCPRCGQVNACGMSEVENGTPCWCFTTPIDRAVLDALPEEQRDQACLCSRCAQGLPVEPAAD